VIEQLVGLILGVVVDDGTYDLLLIRSRVVPECAVVAWSGRTTLPIVRIACPIALELCLQRIAKQPVIYAGIFATGIKEFIAAENAKNERQDMADESLAAFVSGAVTA